jgi:hypothetical protein
MTTQFVMLVSILSILVTIIAPSESESYGYTEENGISYAYSIYYSLRCSTVFSIYAVFLCSIYEVV